MLSGELSGAGGGEGSGTQEESIPCSIADPGFFQSLESASESSSPWLATPSWPVFTLQTVQQGEGHAVTSETQESP